MSRFKDPEPKISFYLGYESTEATPVCKTRGHSGFDIASLERFDIIVNIDDCAGCVKRMVNEINRCRSKRQLYLLLTKMKEKYGNKSNESAHSVFPV